MSESKVNEAISHGSSPEGEIEVLSPSQISQQPLSKANIHRNMILLVLMDTVWIFGVTEMGLASSPLYVYLKTSNTMIGLINATGILGLIGIFLSPFITIHFPIKKLYLLIVNIPYLLPWGLIGCALIFSRQMGLSNHFLLIFIVVMSAISGLSAGFVTLPHQEYIAACIPMSYRGRLSGYGGSLGSGLAIISNILAGWILLRLAKPEAYGYLYVMTWFFCQAGYILALFARERRSPVEKSPKPWSKTMIKVALCDKPFMRVVALQAIYGLFISPIFFQFIAVYGFKDLKMAPASAAVIGVTQRIFSLFVCGYIGYLIDRWSPKIFFHYLPLTVVAAVAPILIWHDPATIYSINSAWAHIHFSFHPAIIAVYVSLALAQIVGVGQYASFNALIYGLPSPENRAGHFTFQIFALYIAGSLGPVLVGVMCDLFSYRTVFFATTAAAILLLPLSRYILSPLSTKAEDYS